MVIGVTVLVWWLVGDDHRGVKRQDVLLGAAAGIPSYGITAINARPSLLSSIGSEARVAGMSCGRQVGMLQAVRDDGVVDLKSIISPPRARIPLLKLSGMA